MISRGYGYHFVRGNDVDSKTPHLGSVQVVNKLLEVFPHDLLGIPPEREIDFCIDHIPDTQPISIQLYIMAPTELMELKEKLKDLLDKCFIRPSISSLGAHYFSLRRMSLLEYVLNIVN